MTRFFAILLLFVIAFSLSVSLAFGFNPVEENAQWEVPRYGAPSQVIWQNYHVEKAKGVPLTPVEQFASEYGGDWYYQINQITGEYHHIYGSGVEIGVSVVTPEAGEDAAREFIKTNPALFGVSNEDLVVMSNTMGMGKRSVIFQQTYNGLRVWGGRVHLVFTQGGRLFEFGSDAYPGINISTTPSLSQGEALAIAKDDIGFVEGRDQVSYKELLILPVEEGKGVTYRLAYRFDLKTVEPFGIWATYVDANSGEILWRENHIRFADYTGHSQGNVEWDGYCDGYTSDSPLRNMRIDISGVGSTTTDVNGDFTISGGAGSQTISAEFRGPYLNVDRYTGGDATHSGTIEPGVPYTIDWNLSGATDDELDVFSYVNKEHDWLKVMDPSFTDLDYEMVASIQRTDLYCPGNAWWDGSSVNFCEEGSGYANTGRMGDVVYHEYGHGITDFLYGSNDPPGDLHEGNSDIVANYLTRESVIGLGFYLDNCSSGIRNSDNTLQYPCSGDDHYCGQLIAGFHWDAWQELLNTYPQSYADSVAFYTWHYGRKLGLPQTQPDQVHWTFVADDDDGDLSNGTPHYDAFCTAATNHGFTCPEITSGVFITHTPIENTSNTTTPYEVLATITSTAGTIVEDSCRVRYRVNQGTFQSVPMVSTGNPDEYVGYIPAQSACSQVDYYIYAADDAGFNNTDPSDAPSGLHTFLVGYDLVFEDDFETDKGWTAGVAGDDATTGVWERCDPEGTEAQPEDDHTPDPGVRAYITQCASGSSQGDYDVDGGRTTLRSPAFDLSTYTEARVSYYRWYSNDTGAEPGQDYWIVEVNDNSGSGWVRLEYTNQSDRSWRRMDFNVGDFVSLTSSVQFQFIASDSAPGSLVEAGVDDFMLVGCTSGGDTIAPDVTVVQPNGGEILVGGSDVPYQIRWSSSDNVGVTVTNLLLSTDGGSSFPDTIASGNLDSTYDWFVPDIDAPTCRIKVVCFDQSGNEGSDISDGDFEIKSISGLSPIAGRPTKVVLLPAQPTPFGTETQIEFGLPVEGLVRVRIYGADGRLVLNLIDQRMPGGYHIVTWTGKDSRGEPVSPGVYFCRLETKEKAITGKILVVR